MKQRKPIITYEFGNLYIEGQPHKEGDTALPRITFDNLWDFILSNNANDDTDSIMSVHTRGGNRYIRTHRYVGTVQTKDGQVIEILPKIYKSSDKQDYSEEVCRSVFLNMLRHFTDTRTKSFQYANLNTRKAFPIFEVYISNYVSAVEELVLGGLKKNYSRVSENQRFLRGRLDIPRHLSKNIVDKSRFAVQCNRYIEDIPQNRIVVSTLKKLFEDTHSSNNKTKIAALLGLLSDIPSSSNIEKDLKLSLSKNRLFSEYELLIKWSSQFLLNKGFTNFSGSCVNQSLLFQAERLFENFIAFLFKKYAPTYNESLSLKAETQITKYCLVDRHEGKGVFRLRPDIVVETEKNNPHYECIILDTKWKAIDGDNPDHNYLIDMKDMYQMYAYGQKYRQGKTPGAGHDVIPRLILIYPYSEKFTRQLPEFVYEDILDRYGLSLMVVPFDLIDSRSYENQVHNIIRCAQVLEKKQPLILHYDSEDGTIPLVVADSIPEYNSYVNSDMMLVACYKDKKHKEWIESNGLYEISLGGRYEPMDKSGLIISASRLLLYNKDNPSDYRVYNLDVTKQVFASPQMMKDKGYPYAKISRGYILYLIGEEISDHPPYDPVELRQSFAPNAVNTAPFFVNL